MNNPLAHLRHVGPGLVIAATGLGAGDLIAASVAGAKFGTTILWAAVLGAIMKYVMNEGLTRWQLATGRTGTGRTLYPAGTSHENFYGADAACGHHLRSPGCPGHVGHYQRAADTVST
jgi:hypothetical protein